MPNINGKDLEKKKPSSLIQHIQFTEHFTQALSVLVLVIEGIRDHPCLHGLYSPAGETVIKWH